MNGVRIKNGLLLAAMVIIAVLSVLLVKEHERSVYYRRVSVDSGREAASELAMSVDEIESLLDKCAYSPSDSCTRALCTRLYGACVNAAASMQKLPWQHELENVSRMLDQISMKAMQCTQTGKADRASLMEMRNDVKKITSLLPEESDPESFGGTMLDPYRKASGDDPDDLLLDLSQVAEAYGSDESDADGTVNHNRPELPEIPGLSSENWQPRSEEHQKMRIYTQGDLTIGTDGNGRLIYYDDSSTAGGSSVSAEDCLLSAREFADSVFGLKTEPVSYTAHDGFLRAALTVCNGSCRSMDHEIIVVVDGGTGKVVQCSAAEYYGAADGLKDLLEREDLRDGYQDPDLPAALDISTRRFSTIRSPWAEDRMCAEYVGRAEDGTQYIVYYDCETGTEIDLRIIAEKSGSRSLR